VCAHIDADSSGNCAQVFPKSDPAKSYKTDYVEREKMKARFSKIASASTAIAIAVFGLTAIVPSTSAAGLPSVRLVSPAYTAANSVDSTGDIAQYYSPGTKAFYTYIAAGSTLTLKYHATTDGTTAAANIEIALQVNAPWSGSKANWVSGTTVVGPQDGGNFGAELKGKTDASGDVTFVITNTDTKSLENPPSALNQDRDKVKPARLYGTMKPIYPGKGDKESDTDLVTFDVASSLQGGSTPTVETPKASGLPSMRLVSPVYTKANSVDSTGDIAQYYSADTKAFYAYQTAGSSITLKYLVTTDGKTPLANKMVSIQVNAPWSGSKAHWMSGNQAIGPQSDGGFGAEIKKKTNAKGEVTFTLKNTDTANLENAPTAYNQDRGAIKPAALYGTIKPIIPGFGDKEADTDLLTLHVHAAIAKSTIKCSSGSTVKTVIGYLPACPAGYTIKK
jgi:TfoX/Sxy family transcriptional regulator of competence genes